MTVETSQPPLSAAVSGVASTASAALIQMVTQVAAVTVLSRLLSPADFGLVAPIVALVGIASILAEGGMAAAVINSRHDVDHISANALTLTLTVPVVLLIAVLGAAPMLLPATGSGPAGGMLYALGLIVLLQPLATLLQGRQLKDLRFRRVAAVDVLSSVLAVAVIPIGLALLGFGAWSLVLGQVARPVVSLVAYVMLAGLPPRPRFDAATIREMLAFSGFFTVARLASGLLLQGDRVVMGAALPAASVGLYTRAQNVVQLTLDVGTSSLDRVLFPLFAKADSTEATARWYQVSIVLVAAVMTPIAVGVALSSEFLVALILGPQWQATAVILTLLAPLIFLRSVDRCSAALLRRSAWVRLRAGTQLAAAVVMLVAVYFASGAGIVAAAGVVLVVSIAAFVATQFIVSSSLSVPVLTLARNYLPAVVTGVITALIYTPFVLLGQAGSWFIVLPALLCAIVLAGMTLLRPGLLFGVYAPSVVKVREQAVRLLRKARRG